MKVRSFYKKGMGRLSRPRTLIMRSLIHNAWGGRDGRRGLRLRGVKK